MHHERIGRIIERSGPGSSFFLSLSSHFSWTSRKRRSSFRIISCIFSIMSLSTQYFQPVQSCDQCNELYRVHFQEAFHESAFCVHLTFIMLKDSQSWLKTRKRFVPLRLLIAPRIRSVWPWRLDPRPCSKIEQSDAAGSWNDRRANEDLNSIDISFPRRTRDQCKPGTGTIISFFDQCYSKETC
jgi:hypothetical protein